MKIYRYIFLLFLFIEMQTVLFGQSGKFIYYFDKDMNLATAADARYLGVGVKENGKIKFSTYLKPSNIFVMKGYFTDSTLSVKEGLFTFYDSLGFAESEGLYKNNLEEGHWLFWKDGLSDSVYFEKGRELYRITFTYHRETENLASRVFHDNRKMMRETQSWDTAGVLESKVLWEAGVTETHTYYPDGKIKEIERTEGENVSTRNFSETGEDITLKPEKIKGKNKEKVKEEKYFPGFPSGENQPFFPGGQAGFMDAFKRNLRLPPSNTNMPGSSSLAMISFKLNSKGYATDIVVKGVGRNAELAIISTISKLPAWKMNGLTSFGPINISLNISTIY